MLGLLCSVFAAPIALRGLISSLITGVVLCVALSLRDCADGCVVCLLPPAQSQRVSLGRSLEQARSEQAAAEQRSRGLEEHLEDLRARCQQVCVFCQWPFVRVFVAVCACCDAACACAC
jgi:hypothetical protein